MRSRASSESFAGDTIFTILPILKQPQSVPCASRPCMIVSSGDTPVSMWRSTFPSENASISYACASSMATVRAWAKTSSGGEKPRVPTVEMDRFRSADGRGRFDPRIDRLISRSDVGAALGSRRARPKSMSLTRQAGSGATARGSASMTFSVLRSRWMICRSCR